MTEHATDLPALLQQGLAQLNAGQLADAARSVDAALRLDPRGAQAWFLAGLVRLAAGQREAALHAFANVVKLAPGHGLAWAHAAELCVTSGRMTDAEHALASAIRLHDPSPNAQHMIGLVLSMLEAHDAALPWYARASAAEPANLGFLMNQATGLMYTGRLDEARRVVATVLAHDPQHAMAHWLLAGLRRATDDSHLHTMRAQLDAGGAASPQTAAYLHYACGKELEDLGRWAEAFNAFSSGAAARRNALEYDEAEDVALFDTLSATFTRGWLQQGSTAGNDDPAIFIVGQPRSGTTLIERVLTAHPEVQPAGELRHFIDALRHVSASHDLPRLSGALAERAAAADLPALARTYLASTRRYAVNGRRFVDKQLSNYLYLPLILKTFPRARVLHVRRAPMDACFSSFKQLFTTAYPHSYRLDELARHYARYDRLMTQWRERFADRFIEVWYEDVVGDLEGSTRRLLDSLGLPWHADCLAFHRQANAVSTASAVQVREPAHTRSVGRWRRYATQLQPLHDTLTSEGVDLDPRTGAR
jgi:tetratricopeptide (TPR) repeat protein